MKTIELSQGQQAIVDDADYESLSQWKWHARWSPAGRTYYAARNTWKDGKRTVVQMHRAVLGIGDPEIQVDHRNHHTTDNRRENLRIATRSQNQANRRKQKGSSLIHKGISWDKQNRKWRANIQVNGKRKYIGRFTNELDAAQAYRQAASKYFGEFANA